MEYKIPGTLKTSIEIEDESFQVIERHSNAIYNDITSSNNQDRIVLLKWQTTLSDATQKCRTVIDICKNELDRIQLNESLEKNKPVHNFKNECEQVFEFDTRLRTLIGRLATEPSIKQKFILYRQEESSLDRNRGVKSNFVNDRTVNQRQYKPLFNSVLQLLFDSFQQRLREQVLYSIRLPINDILYQQEKKEQDNEESNELKKAEHASETAISNIYYNLTKDLPFIKNETVDYLTDQWNSIKEVVKPLPATVSNALLSLSKKNQTIIASALAKMPAGTIPPTATQLGSDVVTMQITNSSPTVTLITTVTEADINVGDITSIDLDNNTTALVTKTTQGGLKALFIRILRNRFMGGSSREIIKSSFVDPLKDGQSMCVITAATSETLINTTSSNNRKHLTVATLLAMILAGRNLQYVDTPYHDEPIYNLRNQLAHYSTTTDNFSYITSTPDQEPLPLPSVVNETSLVIPETVITSIETPTIKKQILQFNPNNVAVTPNRKWIQFVIEDAKFAQVTEYQLSQQPTYEFATPASVLRTDVQYNGEIYTYWYQFGDEVFFGAQICTVDTALYPDRLNTPIARKISNTVEILSSIKGILSVLTTWGERHPNTNEFVELEWNEIAKRSVRFMGHMTAAYAASNALGPIQTQTALAATTGIVYGFSSAIPVLLPQNTTSYLETLTSASVVGYLSQKIYGNVARPVGIKPQSKSIVMMNDSLPLKQQQSTKKQPINKTVIKEAEAQDNKLENILDLVDSLTLVFQYCIDKSTEINEFDELKYQMQAL